MSKWWLISDEDIKSIKQALQAPTHEPNDYNCQDWPIGEGCRGCKGDEEREEALHILDSSLHLAKEIPKDFRFCQECGEFKPDDDRVKAGMKCGQCTY